MRDLTTYTKDQLLYARRVFRAAGDPGAFYDGNATSPDQPTAAAAIAAELCAAIESELSRRAE